jgi:hypothetical protein
MFDRILAWFSREPKNAAEVAEQLVQRSQELGRQIDELREQRKALKQEIDERLKG